MKRIIIYGSKYGCTEKAVGLLVDKLNGDVPVINVMKEEVPDLNSYDQIIIGGSIYAGNIQNEIKELCEDNLDLLLKKNIALFICCGFEEKAEEQLREAVGDKIFEHALAIGYFGYEFNFDKMNFFEKLAVKFLAKIKENTSDIRKENIEAFARQVAEV